MLDKNIQNPAQLSYQSLMSNGLNDSHESMKINYFDSNQSRNSENVVIKQVQSILPKKQQTKKDRN